MRICRQRLLYPKMLHRFQRISSHLQIWKGNLNLVEHGFLKRLVWVLMIGHLAFHLVSLFSSLFYTQTKFPTRSMKPMGCVKVLVPLTLSTFIESHFLFDYLTVLKNVTFKKKKKLQYWEFCWWCMKHADKDRFTVFRLNWMYIINWIVDLYHSTSHM